MADEVVLFMKDALLAAAPIGKVATVFKAALSTVMGGGGGGGVTSSFPTSFLQEDIAANNNKYARSGIFRKGFFIVIF